MDIRFLKSEIKAYGIKNMQEKTGLSRSHINSILKGLVEPKLSTLGKMMNYYRRLITYIGPLISWGCP